MTSKPRGVETAGHIAELTLPFPPKALWPNGRPHWAAKARAVKSARREAWGQMLAAVGAHRVKCLAAKLAWTIHPKTAHAIDDDAPPSAMKAYRDGIADALGVDDKFFTATYAFADPIKGGLVRVTIEAMQ